MSRSYDAIIIGAGIIGTATALALSRSGRRVLVCDKNPAAGYGSTSASSAIIRTFYSSRAGCALAWEGLQIWRQWRQFLGAGPDETLAGFRPCPALLPLDGDSGVEAILSHHDALAIPYRRLDAEELKQGWPMLDLTRYGPPRRPEDEDFGQPSGGELTGAVLFPESGYVDDPQLAARNMQHAAERLGAHFRFGCVVTGILRSGGGAAGVELADGTQISAPVVVNAAGPYSSRINQLAGALEDMNLATRALRQEVCHLPALTGFAGQVIMCDADIGCYWRTEPSGALLVGGMEPDCDPLEWVDDPDQWERNPSEQWTAQAYRAGLRLPSLGIPNQAGGVAELYDVSDDWTPIYDISALPGFFMAVGTSGNQFKNGPIAGELMAALIDWQAGGHDHDREPCRLNLTRSGGTLDLAAFSRRRKPVSGAGNVLG